jgi:hypothetical protein
MCRAGIIRHQKINPAEQSHGLREIGLAGQDYWLAPHE